MTEPDLNTEDISALYEQPVLILDPGMHTAMIKRADIDAAGRYAVTGSDDKTVRVWDAATGEMLRVIRLPSGPENVGKVYAVAISPDGTLIAAGGFTNAWGKPEMLYLFDRESGKLAHRIEGLPSTVNHIVFSLDGQWLAATLNRSNGIRVYGRDDGWSEIARDTDYGGDSYGATFASDGRLATTSLDGFVRLYDAKFKLMTKVEAPGRVWPVGIAFNPIGDTIAAGYRDKSAVSLLDGWDLTPRLAPDTTGLKEGGLSAVAFSVDGKTLFASVRYTIDGKVPVLAWETSGTAEHRMFKANHDTIMSLRPLGGGDIVVAAADPYLARFSADGARRWESVAQQADLRDQRFSLSISGNGSIVDFAYQQWGKMPARIDVAELALTDNPTKDEDTQPPEQKRLNIENWANKFDPTLDGERLPLDRYETSRSLAIHPDGERYVLGTDWNLRAFDKTREQLWRRKVPGIVWAVNISGDGRLVVAAYGDGTIRWHKMENGEELLALFPFINRKDWVAWTPDGFYAATPGAHGILKWHVNRGWDQAAEAIPVHEIKGSRRPAVLPLVLQEMDIVRALGIAELAEHRRQVQIRTKSTVAPGARLHVLAMGVSDYGERAEHLRLEYAHQDAHDIASALVNTQGSLYADVSLNLLQDEEVNRRGILQGFASVAENMKKSGDQRDLAVVHFSGHGARIGDDFYLMIHGVETGTSAQVKATALPLTDFQREVHALAKHGRVLVLLDACYSGAATGEGPLSRINADMLRAALAATNVTVLTSSSSEEESFERPEWQNGAFTEVFLQALVDADTNKDGLISVPDLTGYLRDSVRRLTDYKQTPHAETRFQDDIFAAGL